MGAPLRGAIVCAKEKVRLEASEGERSDDGGFFRECGEREEAGGDDLVFVAWFEVKGETPEREGGSEDVGVRERALGKPDGIHRGEDDRRDGSRSVQLRT